jgi:transcriptional regulator with XRE-family HTH domain
MAAVIVDERHRNRLALASLLRGLRVAAGLKQAELAALVKMPQSVISKMESGERRVDVLELHLICIATGSTLSEAVARLESEIGGAST